MIQPQACLARTRLIDRRAFLRMAGSAWAASLAPAQAFALQRADAVYASAFMGPDGRFGLATMTEDGIILDRVLLPARAHGLAVSPTRGTVVAFARRPGIFALAADPDFARPPVTIAAVEGRHFFGHGAFSRDGRRLFATENDFEANRGMIGVYDASDGFRRLGEFPSYGIGPHDMAASEDGRFLAVANGGIETHPDHGRAKLNLERMAPSLALIDTESGALVQRHALPAALNRLSTRHLDLGEKGRIWFACQYEGARGDRPPLAGSFAPGEPIAFLDLPEDTTAALANYVGAIAVNRAEGLIGLASPKGGVEVVVEAASGRVLETRTRADAAGIAPAMHGFAVTSYDGRFTETGGQEGARSQVAWDQHVVRLAS
ncbi:hypothetical protein BJF93_04520 [Xaviernesmea oryzae]|uniref:DUF1513 domain-containing protein n=1 Tax=Xaviernesmea oryzae TaxID=464029 RepID=A0A1Q9AUQ5_9HYPH|nr:DUF1513 domain-containing protein [Xaviernesmea oryzae]OLP59172.1 hypothetical protein BJF93_04520 [Xaviernesmea oryzae]SEK83165.1 hypothetical protein SAMN04487976_104137 [Xaviernesmea oryzae]